MAPFLTANKKVSIMTIIANSLIFFLILIFAAVLALYIFQRSLTYFPDKTHMKPEQLDLKNVSEITLNTQDKQKLISWYAKASPEAPTFLYFHGNGGGLANRAGRVALYQNHGYGIFMQGYRGYGPSTGNPTEQNLISDGLLAYDWLIKQGVKPDNIILYGESLGTGIATQIAAKRKVKAVILEAPYKSLVDIGAMRYPFLPVNLLMKDRYESINYIAEINAPLLILHGTQDMVIPVEQGKQLFEKAKKPKEIKIYKYGGHNDLYTFGAWEDTLAHLKGL